MLAGGGLPRGIAQGDSQGVAGRGLPRREPRGISGEGLLEGSCPGGSQGVGWG